MNKKTRCLGWVLGCGWRFGEEGEERVEVETFCFV